MTRSLVALALVCVGVALGDSAPGLRFGLFSAQDTPPDGWTLATAAQLQSLKAEFVAYYNANAGLPVIAPFKTTNCCMALSQGLKLTLSGTKYGVLFPGTSPGGKKLHCNPAAGYAKDETVAFFGVPTINAMQTLGTKVACASSGNPGVFIWSSEAQRDLSHFSTQDLVARGIRFGIADLHEAPGGEWSLISSAELQARKDEFINAYNAQGGLPVIKVFKSGNCCIALKGGNKLTVTGTRYGFVFPADPAQTGVRCNPAGGYTGKLQFLRVPKLGVNQNFGEKAACSTNHNPALYALPKPSAEYDAVQFGLYDLMGVPAGGGWEPASVADINNHREVFVQRYNELGGLKVIKPFSSVNCCIALKGGRKIVVAGSKFKVQFPALSSTGGIRCNPTGGYQVGQTYGFYLLPRLTATHVFTEVVQCSTNHNPTIMIRRVTAPPTPAPTTAPTRKPTPAPTPAAVHCDVDEWSSWSICSRRCGSGTQSRWRAVLRHAAHGGYQCPATSEERSCNTQPCPKHCEVSDWGSWGGCSATCGTGTQMRSRSVTQDADGDGNACPRLSEGRACVRQDCPVHCELSEWSAWSACNAACGGGTQIRARLVLTAPNQDGDKCQHLSEQRACGTNPCPVACSVSDFSPWSSCDAECGGGHETRRRVVHVTPDFGGAGCPHLEETRQCATHPCPVNCQESSWGSWMGCNVVCGGGLQERHRSVIAVAQFAGLDCPPLSDERACNTQPCPVDCRMSDWGTWGSCSRSCGGGTQLRLRSTIVASRHGGSECPPLMEQRRLCNTAACPVDCGLSEWTAWSTCDHSCGGGSQTRSRKVVHAHSNGGAACPHLGERRPCNLNSCPKDCVLSQWSPLSACSASCGTGTRTKTRRVLAKARHGGAACGDLKRSVNCDAGPCPMHCEVSPWGAWGACSRTCGSGVMRRTRSVVEHANHGGYVCPALEQATPCRRGPCPVHCTMSPWSEWGDCTASCNGGMQFRNRTIARRADFGGLPCGSSMEWRACATTKCAVDCAVTAFGPDSACTVTCGGGTLWRARVVTRIPAHGGKPCPALNETGTCNKQPCPIDCLMSPWSEWTPCTKTCGIGGTTSRTRTIVSNPPRPQHGGKACGARVQIVNCDTDACPIHCDVSSWSPWSKCSATCGTGARTRTRSVLRHAAHGGYQCPRLTTTSTCQTRPCPIDCAVGEWEAWGACSVTCGVGTQTRTRPKVAGAAHGGRTCPPQSEMRNCKSEAACPTTTTTPPPVDCETSDWSSWTECSATCGTGRHQRSRSVRVASRHGGAACPAALLENGGCDAGPCPVHCEVTRWGDWSPCSKPCGRGVTMRNRTVLAHANHGGYQCPQLEQQRECNAKPCAIDCDVGDWGAWQECSASCGGGLKTRFRHMMTPALNGGKPCPAYTLSRPCNSRPCPIPCELTSWTHWSECSRSCGGGAQSRSRSIVTAADFGGASPHCGVLRDERPCNTGACPTDCVMHNWAIWSECTASCGVGTRTRMREADVLPTAGGKPCPVLREHKACDMGPCAKDCTVSSWNPWEVCSTTCGVGAQRRTRYVVSHAEGGGWQCPSLQETRECIVGECPRHCEVSTWSSWSNCSATCGGGEQKRSRTVTKREAHGGDACPSTQESRSCAEHECPVHCRVSKWGEWSSCSHSCGSGHRTRARRIVKIPKWQGHRCPALQEVQACNAHECAIDCKLYDWGAWDACSRTCGTGVHRRSRGIAQVTRHGGKGCAALDQDGPCDAGPCPIHCNASAWEPWTPCSVSCGLGERTRHRTVVTHAEHGGFTCPALHQRQQCELARCPDDCRVSDWGQWGECDKTCGAALSKRTRHVTRSATAGGKPCPSVVEFSSCNTTPCPVDCQASEWGSWSSCSVSCGVGTRTQKRRFGWLKPARFGGKACPALSRTKMCDAGVCPIHCEVTAWSTWGRCSQQCDGGRRTRTRSVVQSAAQGGDACPGVSESKPCNTHPCPMPCVTSAWGDWSACSATCGHGTKRRSRDELRPAEHGGKCPALNETAACDDRGCPVDCEMSSWGSWSGCDHRCGGGRQTRSMSVIVLGVHGGKLCPALRAQARECNTRRCTVDDFDLQKRQRRAPPLAAPVRYEIKVETGTHDNAGTSTPVSVQLVGTHGSSAEYELERTFMRGRTDVLVVRVREDVGLLYQLVLRAKGMNGWNPVNFIDVMTPRGRHVQFRANVFLDGKPHDAPHQLAYGLYPVHDRVKFNAIVPEWSGDIEPTLFAVNFTTGSAADAGSRSAMYVQFRGSRGRSNFYELAHAFKRGEAGTVEIAVRESVGLLSEVVLQAGGEDNWYTDGLRVTAPSGQIIRFDTGFYLGEQSAKLGGALHGKHTFFEKAVHAQQPERRSLVPIPQVTLAVRSVHLGDKAHKADGGRTRNVLRDAVYGAIGVLPASHRLSSVFAADNVHLYRKLGLDNELAGVVVTYSYRARSEHDAQQVFARMSAAGFGAVIAARATKLGLRLTVEQVQIGVSELLNGAPLKSWGGVRVARRTMAPTPAFDWNRFDWSREFNTTHPGYAKMLREQQAAQAAARLTPYPTPPPTPPPSPRTPRSCAYGEVQESARGTVQRWVPHGWKGPGLGARYCQHCICTAGELRCDGRACGMPWGGETPTDVQNAGGARACSHTTCEWSHRNDDQPNNMPSQRDGRIKTHHSHKERHGGSHRCAYNRHSGVCTCFCYGDRRMDPSSFARSARGRVAFNVLFHSNRYKKLNQPAQCNYINFERPFNPVFGRVSVVASPVLARLRSTAPLLWVESTSLSSFKVCARELSADASVQLGDFDVDYYAFQTHDRHGVASTRDTPWHSAQSSSVRYDGSTAALRAIGERGGGGGRNCQIVKFAKSFHRVPMVVGTIDRAVPASQASASPRLPLSYPFNGVQTDLHSEPGEGGVVTAWVENVNTDAMEVCFHVAKPEGTDPAAGAGMEGRSEEQSRKLSLNFNWIAHDRPDPRLWYNTLPYSAAGSATSSEWQLRKKQGDGQVIYSSCKNVQYNREFTTAPTVIATAAHSNESLLDWSAAVTPVHRPAATAIVSSSTSGFRVCALEIKATGQPKPKQDLAFQWIAWGPDADNGVSRKAPAIASSAN